MPYKPRTELSTHTVMNQPPPLEDINLFASDQALRGALTAAGGDPHQARLDDFGARCGAARTQEWARQANENPPRLRAFDRFGQRIDEVEFHPAYHELMALGLDHGVSAGAWTADSAGHVLHAGLMFLMNQADPGVTCPMSMTYACVPSLRAAPELAMEWEPRVCASRYDQRFLPAEHKHGITLGMAMTEKQGGSDVRANTTRAETAGDAYRLVGHKWFCSAPMSDAFLTLAYTDGGLTCFLVPRWTPDGERNAIHVMRLKDKLGDRSNASSEIEYHGAWAQRVGEEGRGVRTIIQMVQHTRLDCMLGSAAGMRQALVQALWHTGHRTAFQRRLCDAPAMQAVLADLAIDCEAATALVFRVARSFDATDADPQQAAFMRLATAIGKYWICKRQPGFVYEALECHGGAGFVEDGPMPRLFRQSPLNSIWEGSGNVIALDILRALDRQPDSLDAVRAELAGVVGRNAHYDAHVRALERTVSEARPHEGTARALAESLALALQAAALADTAPEFVFDGFCAARLDPAVRHTTYGTIGSRVDGRALVERSSPAG
ncbi:MAG: DNA alkylation response protein [Gammaproteobacteria bacterium]|jgi:putative acyl-CoA dehydrogenase|nr:DNA alkylation response protein [Gammaproteobacteria bacterium]